MLLARILNLRKLHNINEWFSLVTDHHWGYSLRQAKTLTTCLKIKVIALSIHIHESSKKPMNNENEVEQKQNGLESYNPDTHYLEKKLTYLNLTLYEFLVFFCISAVAFCSTYLGTEHFASEKLFEKNITLYTEFFSFENIKNTVFGVIFVIGTLTIFNFFTTKFELNLDALFTRLANSGIDFIYLMMSTMLGFSLATYVFAVNQPVTPEMETLKVTILKLIFTLLTLAIVYIPTFMVLLHREKIKQ